MALLVASKIQKNASFDRCYKCNEIDKPYVPCPGWHRRPVDTYLDLKDRGGLYTHCLEIKLANGTVIRQDAVPEKPSCESRFRRVWQQTLGMDYRMRVSVRWDSDHVLCLFFQYAKFCICTCITTGGRRHARAPIRSAAVAWSFLVRIFFWTGGGKCE